MIKKAIIPVGGKGSRMYPVSNIYPKEFVPIISNGKIRPAIFYLLDELVEAGIEEIALIITSDEQKKIYEKFLEIAPLFDLEYKNKLMKIKEAITFICNDDIRGFGHSLYFCKDFIQEEDFLLVLGDQIYVSKEEDSCIKQFLSVKKNKEEIVLSAFNTPLEDVSKYGILKGNNIVDRVFKVEKMVEKPNIVYAKDNLITDGNYYSIFGIYLFNNNFMKILYNYFDNLNNLDKEYNLTDFIDQYREKIAYIPNGITNDIGNVESYMKSLINISNIKY